DDAERPRAPPVRAPGGRGGSALRLARRRWQFAVRVARPQTHRRRVAAVLAGGRQRLPRAVEHARRPDEPGHPAHERPPPAAPPRRPGPGGGPVGAPATPPVVGRPAVHPLPPRVHRRALLPPFPPRPCRRPAVTPLPA